MTTQYPDGAYVPYGPEQGPVVTVRFADGGQADFLGGGESPRFAWVRYHGLDVGRTRVDVRALAGPDGALESLSVRKTGIAAADGGGDVPASVLKACAAVCRQRAREARAALRASA